LCLRTNVGSISKRPKRLTKNGLRKEKICFNYYT
jgi:hypothetical protein